MQTMRLVEGYAPPSRLRPDSLGLTLLFTGLFVSGLFFLNPKVITKPIEVFVGQSIPAEKPKPVPTQKPVEHPKVQHDDPQIVIPPPNNDVKLMDQTPIDFTKHTEVTLPPGDDSTGTVIEPPKHDPVLVGPSVDPHYAGYFQPAYPPDEIRAGNTGRVTVRVLIGTDGRVKQIEKVSAASDSFWEATRRRALDKWRFTPATRDGVPYETWKTMSVSFVLNQDQ